MAIRPAVFRGNARTKVQRDKEYDNRRGSAASRGYDGKWVKERKGYLFAHPLCLGCHAVGDIEPATIVDHVEPHKGDLKQFWRRSNWQPSCGWHHTVIKQKLEWQWLRGKLCVADLMLNSTAAIALTRSLRR